MENKTRQLLLELETLTERRQELKTELMNIQNRVTDIQNQIMYPDHETNQTSLPPMIPANYTKGGVPTRVFSILEHAKQCLTLREIVNLILIAESRTEDTKYRSDMRVQAADCLNRYTKKGKLHRFKSMTNEWVYGFSDWFDSNGLLKL